jgi:hypothetical protein
MTRLRYVATDAAIPTTNLVSVRVGAPPSLRCLPLLLANPQSLVIASLRGGRKRSGLALRDPQVFLSPSIYIPVGSHTRSGHAVLDSPRQIRSRASRQIFDSFVEFH